MSSAKKRSPRPTRKERRATGAAGGPPLAALSIPEALRDHPVRTTEELGLRKMADVLEELVEPVAGALHGEDRALLEYVYRIGVAVWNATSDVATASQLDAIVASLTEGRDPTLTRKIVEMLAARRRALFADDRRLVVDLKMNWHRGELSIAIAAVVRP